MRTLEGKTITVLGGHGFIGSSLIKEIHKRGGIVTSTPTTDSVALFHFASYTHVPFEKNPAYHTHEVISSFLHLLPFCAENNIPFIYPSSALVYEDPRPFYHLKKVMEELPKIYPVKALGLRIFPVYGVGEGERGHPTAIAQWIKQMLHNEQPIVYGDGKQARDFIYIDDVVFNILQYFEEGKEGIADIGTGNPIRFNQIIALINQELGTKLTPEYRPIPKNYAHGIVCPHPVPTIVSMKSGIHRMVKELRTQHFMEKI